MCIPVFFKLRVKTHWCVTRNFFNCIDSMNFMFFKLFYLVDVKPCGLRWDFLWKIWVVVLNIFRITGVYNLKIIYTIICIVIYILLMNNNNIMIHNQYIVSTHHNYTIHTHTHTHKYEYYNLIQQNNTAVIVLIKFFVYLYMYIRL